MNAEPNDDLTDALNIWALTRLDALHLEAEWLVGVFWGSADRQRKARPRSEWGRLGVRVRDQRNERSLPGAFGIEWFETHWVQGHQGRRAIHTRYLRRGKGLRYPILRDRYPLALQRRVELLDAEQPRGIAQQVSHQLAQADHVADAVALHQVAQHRDVDVVAQQLPARARIEAVCFGESAGIEPAQEGPFDARPRRAVAISRDSNAADEPVTTTSMPPLSRSRRTKRSQSGTSWISSKHQVTRLPSGTSGTRRPNSSRRKPS